MSFDSLKINVQPGKYIVAVSGGVDSITLLHLLKDIPDIKLLVVHINHGIRPADQSKLDEDLIISLCQEWNIELDLAKLELGADASEDLARNKRHEYLQQALKGRHYNKIITAHHKDDVIETMIINLLRGTGRKGLSSLKDDEIYKRPLINFSKEEIKKYAKTQKFKWNEDLTNKDQTILRNYIRLTLLPQACAKNQSFPDDFFKTYKEMLKINQAIDSELHKLEATLHLNDGYDKTQLIMLPIEVSYSLIHHILTQIYNVEVDSKMLKQVRNFIHTAKNSKVFNVNKNLNITCKSKTISFTQSV